MILGKDETRKFLGSLGFTAGESVTVVSENGGNLILSVKDSRIALDRSMAQRIQV
jgi:ferrous iron transport protein A